MFPATPFHAEFATVCCFLAFVVTAVQVEHVGCNDCCFLGHLSVFSSSHAALHKVVLHHAMLTIPVAHSCALGIHMLCGSKSLQVICDPCVDLSTAAVHRQSRSTQKHRALCSQVPLAGPCLRPAHPVAQTHCRLGKLQVSRANSVVSAV